MIWIFTSSFITFFVELRLFSKRNDVKRLNYIYNLYSRVTFKAQLKVGW